MNKPLMVLIDPQQDKPLVGMMALPICGGMLIKKNKIKKQFQFGAAFFLNIYLLNPDYVIECLLHISG
jgi:hypothetical protein